MSAPPDQLTISDGALLDALRAWGADVGPRFWDALRPSWRDRLLAARDAAPAADPAAALARLRDAHRAEARPDLGRVHPSWWVRALKGETPAVRLAVVAGLPPSVRETLRDALGLPAGDLTSDRPPHPEVLLLARTLWAERLPGHRPDAEHDPPIVSALTRLDPGDLARLIPALGLAKWALAGEEPAGLRPRDRDRLDHFRAAFGEPDPEEQGLARRDVAEHGRSEDGRLGLVTVARLLTSADPYRSRWALHHLPYPVARFTRKLMAGGGLSVEVEGKVLGAALDRLRVEGWLRQDRGSPS